MSRVDKTVAERNSGVLKGLLRLPENKHCVDCKRNAHPRWASWPLGVFLCIRCSGIHRSMGTHISRVKSVDLDAWSDEQVQTMRRWGNVKANMYWEANLAEGHVPPEAKMENFIRTKYESKRWVMTGGLPDPVTLLSTERASSVPLEKVVVVAATKPVPAPPHTTPPALQSRPKTERGESLLGLDFDAPPLSNSSSPANAPTRPPSSRGSERSDLKTSILSLYANKAPPTASQPIAAMPSTGLEGFESLSINMPKSGNKTPKETSIDIFARPPLTPPTSTVQTSNDVFAGLRGLSDEPQQPRTKARDSFQSLISSRKASATSLMDDGPTIDTSMRTTRLSLPQDSPNLSSTNTDPSPNSSIRSTRPRQKSSQIGGDEFRDFQSSQGNDEDLFSNVWK